MLAFLESLRKKSKATRDRYAFYGASLVTVLIASAWLLTLPSRYEHINDLPLSETKDDTPGGFVRALGDIKSQFATVLEGLNKPEEVGDEVAGVSPATSSPYTLDVEAVFNSGRATSTGTTTSPVYNTPKTVLIATTSATTTSPAIAQ